MNDSTRAKNGPEMLACSGESREMKIRPSDNPDMTKIADQIEEPVKPRFNKQGIVMKNRVLLIAHTQRLHHLLSRNLKSDLSVLLGKSIMIIQAMVEIALMREWTQTAISLIDFIRCLVQGLDTAGKSSPLLQIPHMTAETVGHATRGKGAVTSLTDFMSRAPDARKGTADFSADQLRDIDEFVCHVNGTKISAKIEVEDEPNFAEGDVATVTITLDRDHLAVGEAEGPVHAPLFPGSKFEEFWCMLVNTANGKMITYTRLRSGEKHVEEKIRFMIGSAGAHHLVLHVVSDSYAGLDRNFELKFTAVSKESVKKEVFIHPEDADLDKYPTLFEQMMGIEKDDEYESDVDPAEEAANRNGAEDADSEEAE
jgi:translocation protein SEC63